MPFRDASVGRGNFVNRPNRFQNNSNRYMGAGDNLFHNSLYWSTWEATGRLLYLFVWILLFLLNEGLGFDDILFLIFSCDFQANDSSANSPLHYYYFVTKRLFHFLFRLLLGPIKSVWKRIVQSNEWIY